MCLPYLRARLALALHDERGDLSAYLAQGILAIATLSLAGVVMVAFSGAGSKLTEIVSQWTAMPLGG